MYNNVHCIFKIRFLEFGPDCETFFLKIMLSLPAYSLI